MSAARVDPRRFVSSDDGDVASASWLLLSCAAGSYATCCGARSSRSCGRYGRGIGIGYRLKLSSSMGCVGSARAAERRCARGTGYSGKGCGRLLGGRRRGGRLGAPTTLDDGRSVRSSRGDGDAAVGWGGSGEGSTMRIVGDPVRAACAICAVGRSLCMAGEGMPPRPTPRPPRGSAPPHVGCRGTAAGDGPRCVVSAWLAARDGATPGVKTRSRL